MTIPPKPTTGKEERRLLRRASLVIENLACAHADGKKPTEGQYRAASDVLKEIWALIGVPGNSRVALQSDLKAMFDRLREERTGKKGPP